MNPLKVLLVGPYDTKGRYRGGISYIVNAIVQCPDLDRYGVELLPVDTCLIPRANARSGKFSFRNLVNALAGCRQLRKRVAGDHPDVVYFNTSCGKGLLKDLMMLRLSRCRKKTKVILHIHNAELDNILPRGALLRRFVLNSFARHTDHLVLLSRTLKDSFVRLGLSPDRITVIYNFHIVPMTDEEILGKIEASRAKPVKDVLFLGILDQRKGIFDLLNAVSRAGVKMRLHVGGEAKDDKARRAIDDLVGRMDDGSVELLGYVSGDDKLDQLRQADILALPSYGEGFPVVIPEAMAAGCAIVTTDVGAIPEFFTEDNGIMVKPGDVDALAAGLTHLCESPSLYDVMLYNRRQSADYDLASFLSQMTDVCRNVSNEP